MPRTSDSIQNFRNFAASWQTSTIAVVCAGTAAIIRGSHQQRGKSPEETVTALQDAVAETGVKTAQIYRYVGLAKAFAARLEKEENVDFVLEAEDAEAATHELVTFLDEQGVASVDAISVLLDTYKRSPKKAPARRAAQHAPAAAERVSTAAIREVVSKAPDEKIVAAFVRAPNKDFIHLATEMAKQIEDRDVLAEVIAVFEERMEDLVSKTGRARRHGSHSVLQ